MKFFIPMELKPIISLLNDAIGSSELGSYLNIELTDELINVHLNRHGNSCLTISYEAAEKGVWFKIVAERISIMHRPFRSVIHSKLREAIARYGGHVELHATS